MKIKIKTYNGELPSYLTVGKVYDGEPSQGGLGVVFTNDQEEQSYASLDNSSHLNGGSWEVVSD